jgi:hypothetical protein
MVIMMEHYGDICKEIIVVHLIKAAYYPHLFYEGLKRHTRTSIKTQNTLAWIQNRNILN